MKPSDLETAMLNRSRDLAACTKEFLETIAALRAQGRGDVEVIWNAACHVNVVDHDISALLYFGTSTEDLWARRTAARMLATVIYEAGEDLSQLLGKKFIEACETAECYKQIEAAHHAARGKLAEFRKKHEATLKRIRHQAGAHKEQDALAFLSVVTEVDPEAVGGLACDFMDVLLALGKMCSSAIEEANATYRRKGVIP